MTNSLGLGPEQRTLAAAFELEGSGLHSGKPSRIRILPAPLSTGIIFRSGGINIPALAENVFDTQRGTSLRNGQAEVRTVEHILSALRGMGVDNAYIEFQGKEAPALDGSSWPIVERIIQVGLTPLAGSKRRVWRLAGDVPFVFSSGLSSYKVIPDSQLTVQVSISFPGTPIGIQELAVAVNGGYPAEISRARTFCLMSEVDELRARGLAKGGSLRNTIVVGAKNFQCDEPLRYPDECVRHKILDLIGDLSLFGPGDFRFNCVAFAPSHRNNVKLMCQLRDRLIHD